MCPQRLPTRTGPCRHSPQRPPRPKARALTHFCAPSHPPSHRPPPVSHPHTPDVFTQGGKPACHEQPERGNIQDRIPDLRAVVYNGTITFQGAQVYVWDDHRDLQCEWGARALRVGSRVVG